MFTRMLPRLAIVLTVLVLADCARAMDEILGETKEQLKLKYDVTVRDLGNGRVFVTLTIADEGRLKPLRSVDLQIAGQDKEKDGSHPPDLWLSLATRKSDGKQQAEFELRKELAERAEIWLMTSSLDGNHDPLTGYVHMIPVAKYRNSAAPPRPEPAASAPPAAPAPPATELKKN